MNGFPDKLLNEFELQVGLPENFCVQLIHEHSWSLVIKLHAVFEAALTQLLEAELHRPELVEFVSSMNMGGQFGKLNLARSLNVLEDRHLRFLQTLGTMRNAAIHNIQNVNFQFQIYLETLPSQRRSEVIKAVRGAAFYRNTEGHEAFLDELTSGNMKTAVFTAGITVLAEISKKAKIAQEMARINVAATDEALAQREK